MVTLIQHSFSPLKVLSFSSSISMNSTKNSTTFDFLGGERAMLCPIMINKSRNGSISSKPRRDNGDVTEKGGVLAVLRVLGLHEREIEAVLERNPGLGLLPVELIRSRIQGLQSVGLSEVALSKLIFKHSDILTAEEVGCLIEFIRDGFVGNKIESAQIERLLKSTGPSFLAGFEEKVRLLVEYGISKENIAHVLNNVSLSKAFCLRSIEEIQRMLEFLTRFDSVGIIVKRPMTLHCDLDTQLVPRIMFLLRLSGESSDGVGIVLRKLPAIVSYSVEHLRSHVEFFRSFVGLSDEQIFRIVLIYPNVMSTSVERKLRPRVEFLQEFELDSVELYRFIIRSPLFLGLSFERNLSVKLAMLVKIGYVHRTKELAMALGATTRTRCEYLQQVIGLFLGYGFTCDDIVAMTNKHFQILQYNPKSLEEKMEYLIEEMDREIGELLSFPAFLGYNLKTRIKPRYELKKKIVGEDMSLNKLLSVSSAQFSKSEKKQLDEEDTETDEMVYETTV